MALCGFVALIGAHRRLPLSCSRRKERADCGNRTPKAQAITVKGISGAAQITAQSETFVPLSSHSSACGSAVNSPAVEPRDRHEVAFAKRRGRQEKESDPSDGIRRSDPTNQWRQRAGKAPISVDQAVTFFNGCESA